MTTLQQAVDTAKQAVQSFGTPFEIFEYRDRQEYFIAIQSTVHNGKLFEYVGYVSIAGAFTKRSYK